MTKHILILATVAVAGYFSFSAFGPKQDAQKAEIASAVTAKLNDLRAEKEQECNSRVAAEAQRRYDEAMAAAPVAPVTAAPTKKPITSTKKGSKGPKVDPLPQPSAPKQDPQKTRSGAVQEGNVQQQKERSGAVQEGTPQTPAQQKKRSGAVKVEGGGN